MQAFAGIVTVSVGHCHPKVVQAVDRQNHLLQHTTNIYLNNEIAEYAQELTAKLPGKLNVSLARLCVCGQQCHACTGSDLTCCESVCLFCLWQSLQSHLRSFYCLVQKLLLQKQATIATAWLTFCSPVQVAYFVNSGSEANDMAILIS